MSAASTARSWLGLSLSVASTARAASTASGGERPVSTHASCLTSSGLCAPSRPPMPAITMGKRGVTIPPFLHSSAIASTWLGLGFRVQG